MMELEKRDVTSCCGWSETRSSGCVCGFRTIVLMRTLCVWLVSALTLRGRSTLGSHLGVSATFVHHQSPFFGPGRNWVHAPRLAWTKSSNLCICISLIISIPEGMHYFRPPDDIGRRGPVVLFHLTKFGNSILCLLSFPLRLKGARFASLNPVSTKVSCGSIPGFPSQ